MCLLMLGKIHYPFYLTKKKMQLPSIIMHFPEMAMRGLGFQPADVMNLVQDFVNKKK